MNDLVSRQDAIDAIRKSVSKSETEDSLCYNLGLGVAEKVLKSLPSAEPKKGTLTEEVREALMRLTMCAREECGICKYESECDHNNRIERATKNMHIVADELEEPKTGEWQKEIKGNGWNEWAVLTCDQCGAVIENPTFETNFCPNCGCLMTKGD